MKNTHKLWMILGLAVLAIGGLALYLRRTEVAVLDPAGPVAYQERQLIITVVLLSLFVVIPVFGSLLFISLKYRASTHPSHVTPTWDHSRRLETVWWLFPTLLIAVLSVITWRSTHALASPRNLVSSNPPITIQVVALQWKWLFIYPTQHIATVNNVVFPSNTPIHFDITADAPMNSFWIPQLGGQIYAMSGMTSRLNLMASRTGTFRGSSANISGDGFASMVFSARAVPNAQQFNAWVHSVRRQRSDLTVSRYTALAAPSIHYPTAAYRHVANGLFERVLMKYMAAPSTMNSMPTTAAVAL